MRNRKPRRTGATLIEGAFCLAVLFFMVVGMLEFGVASLRRNLLREGASRVARAAMLRGRNTDLDEWGPSQQEMNGADENPIAAALLPVLTTMSPEDVAIVVDWPDADNRTEKRVNVVLTYEHRLLFGQIWFMDQVPLTAECQMRIEK
ncbi:TadE/TadG family type IV pilus assembly protein [Blastopirellula marina]|uniref:TadE-like domain-containing protein n=1 Tax=Blastopirellula marina TaxID=124 RepID=A0A2S8GSB4_9BACT|nr:TadE family protein [Blastopirellula marina]PQO26461.1 hypothetical protein C5Y98_30450 [Blastopirellula marina]PQO46904.1 hypothetical protein C5Y93_07060 [Blastopirellula marina]PTL40774.1 pilus assembly protein [Blastopirellula marina]